MSRRSRKYFKLVQKATTRYKLQEIASQIRELDKRTMSYDEALTLGNIIQHRADQLPGDTIVYAISIVTHTEKHSSFILETLS